MRLSSMADYAVLTMTAAARHCGSSLLASPDGRGRAWISSAQLARETGLPAPTVQKLVSKLSAAGLLQSARGAGGGLKLARPAAAITLADIIEAVEGPISLTACLETTRQAGRNDCTLEAGCTLRGQWPVVNAALRSALAAIPLTQLTLQQSPASPVPPVAAAGLTTLPASGAEA